MIVQLRTVVLLFAAGLGSAQAAGSAAQTISFRMDPFSRAQLSATRVALAAANRGGQGGIQAAGTLDLMAHGSDLRVLVRAEQTLPLGVTLAVRASGAASPTVLGDTDTDLPLPAGAQRGAGALALSYELRGLRPGTAELRVTYTILDR